MEWPVESKVVQGEEGAEVHCPSFFEAKMSASSRALTQTEVAHVSENLVSQPAKCCSR